MIPVIVNIRSLPDSAGPGVATAERLLICLERGTQTIGPKQRQLEKEDETLGKVFLFGISQTCPFVASACHHLLSSDLSG